MNKQSLLVSIALVFTHGNNSVAWAQNAESAVIEEVIVTALKREATLQEVPISVSVYTGQFLEQLDISEIQDLYVQTPSMAFSRAGGEAQIYIRGIGTNIFGVGVDPSVAVNLDGVTLGRTQMGLVQFLDVDRIEILRGPQGTLYGRNTTGGAINIISKGPTPEWEGYVSVLAGSFDRQEFSAAAGGPITDKVGIRLAARVADDEGFTDDLIAAGSDEIDDNDIAAFRGTVRFEPSDDVTFTLIGDWSDFDSGNRTIRPLDNLGAAEVLGALPLPAFDETRNDLPTFFEWETFGGTGTLDWAINDDLTLTSITSYKEYESDFLFNTDGTEIDITRSNFVYDTEQFSQELRLASSGEGAWSWIGGVYYLHENKFGALGLVRAAGSGFTGGSFIIPEQNITDAYAVFGEAYYQVNDKVKLTGGLRYSSEEKEDFTSVGAVFDLDGLRSTMPVTLFGTPRNTTDDWDEVTPKFGVDVQVSEDLLVYGSISRGFKSGGFNAFDTNPSFEPETVNSLEVGFKSDLADGRVRFNGAAFFYDYEDLQVSTFINGLTLTTNAAEATIIGAELDLTAALTPELNLKAGISLLDAEYDDFMDRQGNNPDGTPRVLDLSSNTLPNAPDFKGNVSLTYERDLGNGNALILFGQVSHQSEVFYTQFNEDIVGEDAITLVDARIAYLFGDRQWELSAFGKNLTDEEYFQNVVRFTSTSDAGRDPLGIGNALGYPAPGTSYGVQLSYSF